MDTQPSRREIMRRAEAQAQRYQEQIQRQKDAITRLMDRLAEARDQGYEGLAHLGKVRYVVPAGEYSQTEPNMMKVKDVHVTTEGDLVIELERA